MPWLFVAGLAANLFWLASITLFGWAGDAGFTAVPTQEPFLQRAVAVYGPARQAGFEIGDLFDNRELIRANGFESTIAGRPYTLVAHRGERLITATVLPVKARVDYGEIARAAGVFWALAFAVLVWLRAERSRENVLLVLFLVLLVCESPGNRIAWPDNRLYFLAWVIGDIPFVVAIVTLALYGSSIAPPLSSTRRTLLYVCYASAAVAFVLGIVYSSAAFITPGIDAFTGILGWAIALSNSEPLFIALLCVAAGIAVAPQAERQRVVWVFASVVPFFIGVTAGNIAWESPFWGAVQNASFFLIPAGLTYAALMRRLFDIGFVINRAAVFTAVTAVVVGAFVLLEWALGKWSEGVGHAPGLALNVALALAIGFSIRWVHGYVDRAVDTVFFRKRHENETALRRYAREAAFFTDRQVLLERTKEMVLAHTEAASAGILLTNALDPNDAAVVAMKAWHDPVDLAHCETSITGDYAFPMLAHGALVGAIVCGAKRNGERFAPDEIDALHAMAHGVGLALDSLSTKSDDPYGVLLEAVRALPDALAARLNLQRDAGLLTQHDGN